MRVSQEQKLYRMKKKMTNVKTRLVTKRRLWRVCVKCGTRWRLRLKHVQSTGRFWEGYWLLSVGAGTRDFKHLRPTSHSAGSTQATMHLKKFASIHSLIETRVLLELSPYLTLSLNSAFTTVRFRKCGLLFSNLDDHSPRNNASLKLGLACIHCLFRDLGTVRVFSILHSLSLHFSLCFSVTVACCCWPVDDC